MAEAPAQQPMLNDEPEPEFSSMGCCCTWVNSGTVHAVQTCGAYAGYANPGCYMYIPGYHTVMEVDVRVRQQMVVTDCKTQDNTQTRVEVAVQYKIDPTRLRKAVFETGDEEGLISSSVQNTVRSTLTTLDLDDAFSNKEDMSNSIFDAVSRDMDPKGYKILKVLMTDIAPDGMVLATMNQINASQRQRLAANEVGEAQKILQVKQAEADAESKALSGQGMARMRVEMAKGFKDSMASMAGGGLSAAEAMNMMITTQYVDMLKDFANNPNKAAVMMPMDYPSKDMEAKVRDGFITAAKLQA